MSLRHFYSIAMAAVVWNPGHDSNWWVKSRWSAGRREGSAARLPSSWPVPDDVAAVYHNAHEQARSLCDEITAMGRRAHSIQANVGSPESVKELFAEFSQTFSRLDIAVSNAASGVLKPALEMTLKHWRWCLETNALALNLLAQGAAALMPADGRIIAMTSLGSRFALPDYAFIDSLEGGPGVIGAQPGSRTGAAWDSGQRGQRRSGRYRCFEGLSTTRSDARGVCQARAVGRRHTGTVKDAVFLLCLPEAAMITGQTLVVDGGFSITG